MSTIEPGDRPLAGDPTSASRVAAVVENVAAAERREREDAQQSTAQVAAGGSTVEALAGITAVILAILGLVGIESGYMFSIAVIAVGVALLSEGAALAARYYDHPAGTGMNAAFLAGVAGVVLGVLSLLGVASLTLAAVAVLVFGGALLLSAGALPRLACRAGTEDADMAHEATMGAAGAKVLVGVAAIVLGIMALMGIQAPTLVLVALLTLGAALLLSGLAIGSKMLGALRY